MFPEGGKIQVYHTLQTGEREDEKEATDITVGSPRRLLHVERQGTEMALVRMVLEGRKNTGQ